MSYFPNTSGSVGGVASSSTSSKYAQDPSTGVLKPVIYVRPTGSDLTGNGTLSAPYATLERAWRDIPLYTGFDVYFIDITGVTNTYTTLEMPAWQSSLPQVIDLAPANHPDLVSRGSVNIYATNPVLDTAAITSQSQNAQTKLLSITDSSKSWTVNQFKGKIARGAGFFQFGIIASNTSTTLEIAVQSTGWTGPVSIQDYGATLDLNVSSFTSGLFLHGNTAFVQFAGINFTNTAGAANTIFHRSSQTEFTGCAIYQISHRGMPPTNINHTGIHFRAGASSSVEPPNVGSVQRCFFESVACTPNPSGLSSYFMNACIIDTPPRPTGNVGTVTSDNISNAFISSTLVRNSVGHGLELAGSGNNRIRDVRVDGATGAGSGVLLRRNAVCRISALAGTGNARHGLEVTDGSHAQVPTSISITGTLGDMKSGNNATRTWANFLGFAPIEEEVDATTELTRIFT
jgi:hypothetical protein